MFYRSFCRYLTVITHPRSSRNFSTSSIRPAPIIGINYLVLGLSYKDRPFISTIEQPSGASVLKFLKAIQKEVGIDCPPGRLQGHRVDIPLSRGRMDPAFTLVILNFSLYSHPLTLLVGRKLHGRSAHGTRPKTWRLFRW
ncbi:hypothetical protein L211DRAFT_141038 [Terfezia boudieri ATCC MYA-4762]|uniref:Uncharacterized protein n=1 Tax=Terfezia boudieri ATCC MYA-4762 TaxID=1051890 RepID=A0A3N4L6M0_9PEZI|nr:hypothetical protein L211DRAFT_141038 [Terfezia boudieri ATCC MYA-4762]